MLFSPIDESLDALALSLSGVSWTLVDINIRVVTRLLAAFSGLKGCLRLLRAQSNPRQLRDDENLKYAKIFEVIIVRPRSGRSTGTYYPNEHLE